MRSQVLGILIDRVYIVSVYDITDPITLDHPSKSYSWLLSLSILCAPLAQLDRA